MVRRGRRRAPTWRKLLGGQRPRDPRRGVRRRSAGRRQAAIPGWHRARPAPGRHPAPLQLVEEIQAEISPQTPPIVVCGPPSPGAETEAEITRLARQSVVRYAESPERLLEETVLLLHRAEADLSEAQRRDPEARAPERCHAGRQEGAGGGRRRAQHLRAHQRPGAARSAGGSRRKRPRRHRDAAEDARTSTAF